MTYGRQTATAKICLAIDAMVAEGKTRQEIDALVEDYYTKLQMAALEQGVTVKFVASRIPERRGI